MKTFRETLLWAFVATAFFWAAVTLILELTGRI